MELGFKMNKVMKKKRILSSAKVAPSAVLNQKNWEREKRYLALLDNLPVGIYRTTPDGTIIEANPALAKMLGYRESELKKISAKDLYIQKSQRESLQKMVEKEAFTSFEFKLRRKDGRSIWGRDYAQAVAGPDGRIAYYDGILVDITREKTAEEKLKKALTKLKESNRERLQMINELESHSVTDDLTGLYNRRGFFTIAREYLNMASRNKTKMFLLFLDLDHLKNINDSFGHHVGDAALVELAKILKRTFRNSDIKGRMGGDEFAVFPIDASLTGVETVLGRLSKHIKAFNSAGDALFKLSISSGVACYDPEFPSTIEDLMVRADKLMYEEKRQKHGI
jgi:diguanylate cyclase (GGDEF)-like protein/PAS domain S-box-containing protein